MSLLFGGSGLAAMIRPIYYLAPVLASVLAILIYVYLSIFISVQRTTQWIRRVRRDENVPLLKNIPRSRFLRPLLIEIEKMARTLSMARLAVEEEARLRHRSVSVWTPARLKEFIKTKLNGRQVFVVSNREPYRHLQKDKEIVYEVPPSGLVTAMEPVLKACGGTWIAQGDGDADRRTVDEHDRLRVPPEEPQYYLRRVWLDREEEKGFYEGFSNEGLWPLCHIAHTRPIFREEDWQRYRAVNEKFAEAVLQEIENSESPCILVQDYHFALLPQILKSKRPDARVSVFWHIPWPNPESFGICPWQKELLRGMLSADLVGFHTQYHCNNFLETVDRFLEARIDYEHFTVHCDGHVSGVKPFPISIAFTDSPETDGVCAPDRQTLFKSYGIQAEYLGVGVDRLDYTKGILERFRAVELFLENEPFYRERFTFVELAAPSRSLILKYQEFGTEVEKEAERINARFRAKNWKPVMLIKKYHSHREILPFYRAADVCLVTSLHDGMNLVAKEFIRARDDEKGVLVLSQFTGAARELPDALIVNPYDIAQTAQAITDALKMPAEEQTEKMRTMRSVVRDRNIYRWAAELLGELTTMRMESPAKTKETRESLLMFNR